MDILDMDNLWIIYGSGWWYTYPTEKYEFVNWDDDIPNIWKNHPNVPNHQPDRDVTQEKIVFFR